MSPQHNLADIELAGAESRAATPSTDSNKIRKNGACEHSYHFHWSHGVIVFAFLMFAMAVVLFVLSLVNLKDEKIEAKNFSLAANATFLVLLAQCPAMWFINFCEIVKFWKDGNTRLSRHVVNLSLLTLSSVLALSAVVAYGVMAPKNRYAQLVGTSLNLGAVSVTMVAATISVFDAGYADRRRVSNQQAADQNVAALEEENLNLKEQNDKLRDDVRYWKQKRRFFPWHRRGRS